MVPGRALQNSFLLGRRVLRLRLSPRPWTQSVRSRIGTCWAAVFFAFSSKGASGICWGPISSSLPYWALHGIAMSGMQHETPIDDVALIDDDAAPDIDALLSGANDVAPIDEVVLIDDASPHIDALLSGSAPIDDAAAPDIDGLLSGSDDSAEDEEECLPSFSAIVEAAAAPDEVVVIDDDDAASPDIDALLSGSDDVAPIDDAAAPDIPIDDALEIAARSRRCARDVEEDLMLTLAVPTRCARRKVDKLLEIRALRKEQSHSLHNAWNERELRHGEIIDNEDQHAEGDGILSACHPNAWTGLGCTRIAFSMIGCTTAHHQRETSHVLDAQAIVSLTAESATSEFGLRLRDCFRSRVLRSHWLVCQRSHDCTPVPVSFGALHDLLAPIARYYYLDRKPKAGDTCWRKLTLEELTALGLNKNKRSGVLELQAQSLSIHFASPAVQSSLQLDYRYEMPVRPRFLANTRASTLFAGLEDAPLGSFAYWCEISKYVSVIVLRLNSDLCMANLRVRSELMRLATEHNRVAIASPDLHGIILLCFGDCVGHVVHCTVVAVFKDCDMIPKAHSCEYVARNANNYNGWLRGLERMVAEELDFFADVAPPPELARHTEQILQLTLLRSLRVRGRDDGEAKHETKLNTLADGLRSTVNGAWWTKRVQHYCKDLSCCAPTERLTRKEVATQRCTAAIADAFFEDLGGEISENKWWTLGPTLARQAGGHCCHGIIARSFCSTFRGQAGNDGPHDDHEDENPPNNPNGEVRSGTRDDWKAYNQAKMNKAFATMRDPDTPVQALTALAVTESLDKITKRIEHLDEAKNGRSLIEMSDPTGLLFKAQEHLFSIVADDAVLINVLIKQFPEKPFGDILSDVTARTLDTSAHVWTNFETTYLEPPHTLNRLVDPRATEAEKEEVRQNIFSLHFCDCDINVVFPLRLWLRGPDCLKRPWFLKMWDCHCRVGTAANMGCEHLLALYTASVRRSRKKVTAERLVYASNLSELMRQHLAMGRQDCRQQCRKDLVKKGVATRANRNARDKMRTAKRRAGGNRSGAGLARPHLRWANQQLKLVRAVQPTMTRAQVTRQWRQSDERKRTRSGQQDNDNHTACGEMTGERLQLWKRLRFDIGDESWPVAVRRTCAFARSECSQPEHDHRRGAANRGPVSHDTIKRLRFRHRNKIIIFDKNLIPSGRSYKIQEPCRALHFGLCCEDHAGIYSDVLKLAKNIEKAAPREKKGTYVKFANSEEDYNEVYFYAYARARRPHARITHAFAECDLGDTVDGQAAVTFRRRTRRGVIQAAFEFRTPWHIGVSLLRAGCSDSFLHFFKAHYSEDRRCWLTPECKPIKVWPGTVAKPKGTLDGLFETKPRRKVYPAREKDERHVTLGASLSLREKVPPEPPPGCGEPVENSATEGSTSSDEDEPSSPQPSLRPPPSAPPPSPLPSPGPELEAPAPPPPPSPPPPGPELEAYGGAVRFMLDDLPTDDEAHPNDAQAQPDRNDAQALEDEIELLLRAAQSKLVYEDPRLPKQEI